MHIAFLGLRELHCIMQARQAYIGISGLNALQGQFLKLGEFDSEPGGLF